MCSIGGYAVKVKEYCGKAIAISKEIGLRHTQANCYFLLGNVLFEEGEYDEADDYFKKSLAISEDIGNIAGHFHSHRVLVQVILKEGKIKKAVSYLLTAIEKCEKMRGSLRDNDHWKISFTDRNMSSYHDLCRLLCETGNPQPALYVSELGKARALADLMSAKYSVKNQVSANPQTWSGIESVMERERNCSCLYVSYSSNSMYFWILKKGGVMHFRAIGRKEIIAHEGLVQNLEDFFCEQELQKSWHATKGAT